MGKVREHTLEELARLSRPLSKEELAAMEQARLLLLEQALDELTSDRTRAMVSDMVYQQLQCRMDPSRWISICGARRASKTTYLSMDCLIEGEERPGHVTMIGAPTKEWLEQNYWGEAESGIPAVAARYGIELETKVNALTWRHKNGSRGILMGMKGQKEVEAWFGAEANRYCLDEMHRQSEALFRLAIDKSIGPQAVSRKAKVIVAGNPGDVCSGDFWRATDPDAEGSTATPFEMMGELPEEDRAVRWSFHHFTQQGNTAMPHQWAESLALKRRNGWADNHPTWMQQQLGLWVRNEDAMRFNFTPAPSAFGVGGLVSLGLWMNLDQAFLVAVEYNVDTGRIDFAGEWTCESAPEVVVKTYRLAEAALKGAPAWFGGGGEGLSDVLFDWFAQSGLSMARYKKADRPVMVSMVRGALGAKRLNVPGNTRLGEALSSARKELGNQGDYTDALLAAVGQLPAPPAPPPEPPPPPIPGLPLGHPWNPAYLPPRNYGSSSEPEGGEKPVDWAEFVETSHARQPWASAPERKK